MVVNITTTLDVAQKIEQTDIVDIVAISIDDYRTGKDWDKYAEKVKPLVSVFVALALNSIAT